VKRTPFGRRTSLARGPRPEAQALVAKAVERETRLERKALTPERRALNAQLVASPRPCALGPGFAAHGFDVCTGRATCWHELRKRSSAGSTVNPANLKAACLRCNDLVEIEPALARQLGFVMREGDTAWDAMSRRHDHGGPDG